MYKSIPTYSNGLWSTTEFVDVESFIKYLLSIFKEPGEYGFTKVSKVFNEEARAFTKQDFYCDSPFRSKDFTTYWEDQKNKCRVGVIYNDEGKSFFLTRDYYMCII